MRSLPEASSCCFKARVEIRVRSTRRVLLQDVFHAVAGGSIDQPAVNTAVTNLHGASHGFLSISANYYAVRKSDYVPDGEDAQNHRLYVVGVYGNLGWTMYRMKHDPMAGVVVEAPQRIN